MFGSLARNEARLDSDLDVVVVRPDHVDQDDEQWGTGMEQWRDHARAVTGNPIEVIDVGLTEARRRLATRSSLWRDIARDGIVVHGPPLTELVESVNG